MGRSLSSIALVLIGVVVGSIASVSWKSRALAQSAIPAHTAETEMELNRECVLRCADLEANNKLIASRLDKLDLAEARNQRNADRLRIIGSGVFWVEEAMLTFVEAWGKGGQSSDGLAALVAARTNGEMGHRHVETQKALQSVELDASKK